MSTPVSPAPNVQRRRRFGWNMAGLAVALLAIVAALCFWASSTGFEDMVRRRLVAQLETATGGRVEIAAFHWRLFHFEAEANGLVIHGDEQPKEAPYAQIARMRVGLSVLGFWSPRILLRYLDIEQPRFHLIVYPDGATNQPHPRKPRRSPRSGLETLFKMKAGHLAVTQGGIDVDDRAASLDFQDRYQPLDFRCDDVSLRMQYAAAAGKNPELFHIEAGVRDLNLARGGTAQSTSRPVHGLLQASLDLTRDAAYLRSLRLTAHAWGHEDRTLTVTGTLLDFAHPRWQAEVSGDLDMRLLNPTLGYNYAPEGIAHLELNSEGHSGDFKIGGTVHAQRASYIGTGVVARGVDLTARVDADTQQLRITSVVARLQQGGQINGEVLLDHWILPIAGETVIEASTEPRPLSPGAPLRKKLGRNLHPPAAAPTAPAPHSVLVKRPNADIPVDGVVNANFKNVSVDTILDLVSHPPFQRLGIDSLLNGPARAVWNHGDVNTLAVNSTLSLSPSGRAIPRETPAQGTIDATYTQRDGAVDLRTLNLKMVSSQLQAHGHLGAYPVTNPTALSVDFHSGNLGEFDAALRSLGLTRNGKSGTAALPIALQGQGEFHGTWAGSLTSPRLQGNASATQLAIELPPSSHGPQNQPRFVHWDSIQAEGSYDAEHIAIVHGQLHRGSAQIVVDGTLAATPPAAPLRGKAASTGRTALRGDQMPAFDGNSRLQAHIRAANVSMSDLLPLTGLNVPVSGALDAEIQTEGALRALGGSGWLQLKDGTVYGEPVSRLRAQGTFTNPLLKLSSLTLKEKAGTATASGSYDLRANSFQFEARGSNIDIAKIERLRPANLSGRLGFTVSASGTRDDPRLEGHAGLAGLMVRGQQFGALDLSAHTTNHVLTYTAATRVESAELALHGQTEMHGNYSTQAKLDFSRFNIAAVLKLAHLEGISADSALAGTAFIAGPLAHPDEMRGDMRIERMAMTVAGVHLQSESAVHASLDHARLSLDPVHITGDQTDLRAQCSLQLKDAKRIDLAANGTVNLKLAQTIDTDLTAGGVSTFQVEAHGPLSNPGLRGRVEFTNGSLALEDVPNGLSQIRGTLEFSQNRLEVRSLTAMTGGGQLSLGGYLAYQHGLYADLAVTGRGVRIRYPQGVSSLADTTLHLQGTQASMLLSGNIMLTRFSVSPDLDIATLAAQTNAVQPVAPPNAPSNHVRLDVRIQSSPQLNFQNAYAKLAGDVDLRLRGTLATPSLLGRISITEGTAVIAGTRYELQRGDITFTNPVRIQPTIDLNATARVEDYDITLSLHGTPDKMGVSYRSDPPLPETDVVALLALGRTQSEQGLYTKQQQQSVGTTSTDVLLGGALNATVSSRVQKLFGAGSVKVDPSYLGALGNSTTRITVEEQLGKNVTLTYATNVDTTAQQLLQAEIAVNRHVSLLVARDESGVFSMVVKATRRYR